jgi:NitT/TauT family transport system substrate-binding protein
MLIRLGLAAVLAILTACSPTPGAAPTQPAVAPPAPTTAAPPAAAQPAPAQPTAAAGVDHVRFATTAGASGSAPVYIALERGYFREARIDLELVNFPGGAQMIPSIAASQVEVANTDAGAGLLNAIARDLPARFVADGASCTVAHCTATFLVRKQLVDSGAFKDLPDLRGKAVNTFTPGSTLYMYLYRMLEKSGLKDTDLNLQVLTFDQLLPAFTTGAIDASWQIDPFTTQSIAQGVAAKVGDAAEILGPQQSTVIVYSPTFATQQTEIGKRFMVAYLRGIRDYDDAFLNGKDRDAIVDILVKYTNLKDASLFARIGLPNFDPNGKILIDSLKANQDWYVGHKDVPTPIDLDKVYDTTFIDYAVSQLGGR